MRSSFRRALERNPDNWYAHLELAIAAALAGDRSDALQRLEQARELNPSEPILRDIAERVRRGEPISPGAVDRLFLQRVEDRTS
jgi:tetratricopeptide (TPR) repeat protein